MNALVWQILKHFETDRQFNRVQTTYLLYISEKESDDVVEYIVVVY